MKKDNIKNEISIITFNVFGAPFFGSKIIRSLFRTKIAKRFEKIGTALNTSSADFILLQEVHTYQHLTILKKKLSNYKYYYFKKYLLGPRGGLATFSKYKCEQQTYVDFTEKGSWLSKSIVGKLGKRGLLILDFMSLDLTVINTHLSQNSELTWGDQGHYINVIRSQLLQITDILKGIAPKYLIFFGGDFNMPKESKEYENFLVSCKLQDLRKSDSTSTKHAEYSQGKSYIECIDYIFASKNHSIKVIENKKLFTNRVKIDNEEIYLSDHIGLQTKFEISSKQLTPGSN